MSYRIIKPEENLLDILTEKLLEQGEDMHKCLVIFPGKRPGYFLRKYLAKKTGHSMRSPAIFSMDGFISSFYYLHGEPRRTANIFDVLSLLLKLMQKGLCGSFVEQENLTGDYLLPLAMQLSEELEEIKKELVNPETIAVYDILLQNDVMKGFAQENNISNEGVSHIFGKIKDFSSLYKSFYLDTDLSGLITNAGKAAWTADFISPEHLQCYKKIFAAGFLRLSASEKKIFNVLEKCGTEFFFENNPLAGKYHPFIKNDIRQNDEPAGKISFYRASDAHGEIYRLAEMLGKNEKMLDENSVIVLPDAQSLFPLLLNALPDGQDFNVSMQCPITVSPVYSLYMALSSLFTMRPEQGYDSASYINFIRHPYIKNLALSGESSKGRIAVQSLESEISGSLRRYFLPEAPLSLKSISMPEDEALSHLRGIYAKFVKPFEQIENISDFCCKIIEVFTLAEQEGTSNRHSYWNEFASVLMESARDLANSALGNEKFSDTSSYFRFFGLILKKKGYPFAGTPVKGLQILGPLETRSIKFKKVYFLDANADVLPPSGRKTKVISDFLRKKIGLLTNKDREEESRFHFENLINSAEEINIFYCDAADKEKSPFVEKLIWQKEQKGKPAESEPAYFTPSFASGEAHSVEKTGEMMRKIRNMPFSPSLLDTYLKCGLRFFYSYCLNIKEKNSSSASISRQDIGTIVHGVLEKFFSEKIGKPFEIDFINDKERICSIAEEELDRLFGNTSSGFEFMFKRQLFRRFDGILYYNSVLSKMEMEILKVETPLSFILDTKYGPVSMNGWADRIDRRAGKIFVVDYKTGSSAEVPDMAKFSLAARPEWPKTLKSVQLPFYLKACSSEYSGYKNASLMMLGKEKIEEKFLFPAVTPQNLLMTQSEAVSAQEKFEAAIKILAEEILDPNLKFNPADNKKECRKCPFAVSCGKA